MPLTPGDPWGRRYHLSISSWTFIDVIEMMLMNSEIHGGIKACSPYNRHDFVKLNIRFPVLE